MAFDIAVSSFDRMDSGKPFGPQMEPTLKVEKSYPVRFRVDDGSSGKLTGAARFIISLSFRSKFAIIFYGDLHKFLEGLGRSAGC